MKREISRQLPEQHIESIVYPTYETKGELAQATQAFLDWYMSFGLGTEVTAYDEKG